MATEIPSCENSGIEIGSHGKLSDLEYADDVVILSKDPSKLKVFLIIYAIV